MVLPLDKPEPTMVPWSVVVIFLDALLGLAMGFLTFVAAFPLDDTATFDFAAGCDAGPDP